MLSTLTTKIIITTNKEGKGKFILVMGIFMTNIMMVSWCTCVSKSLTGMY